MDTSTKWVIGGLAAAGALYMLWPKKAAAAATGYFLDESGSTGLSNLRDASGNMIASTFHGAPPPGAAAISSITSNPDGTYQVTYLPAGASTSVSVAAAPGKSYSGTGPPSQLEPSTQSSYAPTSSSATSPQASAPSWPMSFYNAGSIPPGIFDQLSSFAPPGTPKLVTLMSSFPAYDMSVGITRTFQPGDKVWIYTDSSGSPVNLGGWSALSDVENGSTHVFATQSAVS
jgi:hypothetical protein